MLRTVGSYWESSVLSSVEGRAGYPDVRGSRRVTIISYNRPVITEISTVPLTARFNALTVPFSEHINSIIPKNRVLLIDISVIQ